MSCTTAPARTTSPARVEANRKNAQKSTGPKSPEGKAISALNAVKHGLCATIAVFPGEDAQALTNRREAWFAAFRPRDAVEVFLVDNALNASFGIDRCRAAEAESARMLAQFGPDGQGPPAPEATIDPGALARPDLRLRYLTAHQRMLVQSLRELRALRKAEWNGPESLPEELLEPLLGSYFSELPSIPDVPPKPVEAKAPIATIAKVEEIAKPKSPPPSPRPETRRRNEARPAAKKVAKEAPKAKSTSPVKVSKADPLPKDDAKARKEARKRAAEARKRRRK